MARDRNIKARMKKAKDVARGLPDRRDIGIADLEAAMGKKADAIGDYTYDPETGSWGRTITFKL